MTQGHEVSGEIAEIGKNVSGFQIGQKVTIEPEVYCGHRYPWECRGAEAFDMLQALNTGHDGGLSTAHGNSSRDILSRLEMMVLMGMELPIAAIRQQIASGMSRLCVRENISYDALRSQGITENHTCYNGVNKGKRSREAEQISKITSQFGL